MRLSGFLLRVRTVRPGGRWLVVLAAAAAVLALAPTALATSMSGVKGEADCNGDSTTQGALKLTMPCTDIRGFSGVDNSNTWGGRFYDNGEYIGHDEPDMTFLSNSRGSGNDVTWTERIPHDPSAAPTATNPGHDVAHWFELSVAPWFSMAMCNNKSYPQAPCTPESDSNAPPANCLGAVPCTGYAGGGSAFMEMQFYPPGFAPFDDAISCDNTHWCAALTIDSLECTEGFAVCNTACEEPVNFAYIQRNGVPTGPAGPLEANLQTFTPNSQTLLMNPGDVVRVHMYDAPIQGGHGRGGPGGGQQAFEVVIQDLTTGQSGFMQASAANGFMQTTGIANGQSVTCSDSPYNFQPEYNTAQRDNIVPWAALQTNISTQFETGHWESCTGLANPQENELAPGIFDTFYNTCLGPYEDSAPGGDGGTAPEVSDAFCYPQGDTHGALNTPPDTTTGCLADAYQNGDLDFDGNPYWPEWPVSTDPTYNTPGSFVQSLPTSGSGGGYQKFFIQTDLALSESTCPGPAGPGCSVPPPNAPGHFYPYWSRTGSGQGHASSNGINGCVIEFGNVSRGVNDYGRDGQYGTDQFATYGYPEFIGPTMNNNCPGSRQR